MDAATMDAKAATVTSADVKRAEELKAEGNIHFKAHRYAAAAEKYSQAIDLNPTSPVYFSNRAICHMRLENLGLAVMDGSRAVQLDPKYIKGYYRRGSALFMQGKYKQALRDFKQVVKIVPRDADAQGKLKACQRAVRAAAFADAIASQHTALPSETVNVSSLTVPESYNGPQLSSATTGAGVMVTPEFCDSLKTWFRDRKQLPKRYVVQILLDIIQLFRNLPSLIDISVAAGEEFTVCGDVHGQFYDLLNIFEINGMPSPTNPYLFNGDFVDRGSWSVEVIVLFFALKLCYPNHFHLLRGNHETRTMNSIYGFQGEVKAKYDDTVYELFAEAFCLIPLAAVLNQKVLVVHGGLFSEDGVKLDNIRRIDRNRQPPESGLMCELLWSDPQPMPGRAPSKRGVGLSFGPDVTHRFLDDNGLDMLVRSHEVKAEGYEVEAGGRLVTVFSAPNYCDQMGNKGAFIRFNSDMQPRYSQFTAVPHPAMRPMAYANRMFAM